MPAIVILQDCGDAFNLLAGFPPLLIGQNGIIFPFLNQLMQGEWNYLDLGLV